MADTKASDESADLVNDANSFMSDDDARAGCELAIYTGDVDPA